jgi:hypothetical protein
MRGSIRGNDPAQLLLANVATGCTTLVNRALRLEALPIPDETIMYDHWLALSAVTRGKAGSAIRPDER